MRYLMVGLSLLLCTTMLGAGFAYGNCSAAALLCQEAPFPGEKEKEKPQCKVNVRVLRNGKAAEGETVSLLHFGEGEIPPRQEKSDAKGMACFTEVTQGHHYICGDKEFALLGDKRNMRFAVNWPLVPSRVIHANFNLVLEVDLELAPADLCWVNLKLEMPSHCEVSEVYLFGKSDNVSVAPRSYRAPRYFGTGRRYEHPTMFGYVPMGDYRLEVHMAGTWPWRKNVSLKTGETTLDCAITLHNVSGTLTKPAKATKFAVVMLHPDPPGPYEIAWDSGFSRCNIADMDGKFEFKSVPAGEYRLIAQCYMSEGTTSPLTAQKISVSKDLNNLSVKITNDNGSILVNVSGKPLIAEDMRPAKLLTVKLFDQAGKEVEIPYPLEARTDQTYVWLQGLAPGTYSVAIAARGLLPVRIDKVVVMARETTTVEIKMEPCALVIVNLPINSEIADKEQDFERNLAEVRYEDAQGNPVAPAGPDRQALKFQSGSVYNGVHCGIDLCLHDVGPEVRQVRIMFPGYKDVVVSVEPKPGEILKKEAKTMRKK